MKACNPSSVSGLDHISRTAKIPLVHVRVLLRKCIQRKGPLLREGIGTKASVKEIRLTEPAAVFDVSAKIPVHQVAFFFYAERIK